LCHFVYEIWNLNLVVLISVFATRYDLLEWVRKVAFDLGFVIVILRSDKANRQPRRKTFVLLGCERSGKYKKYKTVVDVSVTDSRKCDCPFKLRGKPSSHGDVWMLKVICDLHNHTLSHTLVGHPYARILKKDEHELVVNMTKSQVKPTNILLTLKEKNAHNVLP